jgi:uncharacterized protein (TIGR02996 family)
MDTKDAFLADICQHPDDDAVRLIYADWLDEHGEPERAEFIRLQIERARLETVLCHQPGAEMGDGCNDSECPRCGPDYALAWRERELLTVVNAARWTPDDRAFAACEWTIFRRGFVEVITLPCAAFVGGPCTNCGGNGEEASDGGAQRCPDCHGTGHIPGHAAALFRAAPVREVRLDRVPYWNGRGYALYLSNRNRPSPDVPETATLPNDLFRLLGGGVSGNPRWIAYPTEQHALSALSAAACLLGRRAAWPCGECKGSDKWGQAMAQAGIPRPCPDCSGTGHAVCLTPAPAATP